MSSQKEIKKQVERFLKDFKLKTEIWNILFLDDRGKNRQALFDLDIRPNDRKNHILSLNPEDYSEGPKEDEQMLGSELWIFGKEINNEEVYIKISLGKPQLQTICISFHIAEYPMNYPLK